MFRRSSRSVPWLRPPGFAIRAVLIVLAAFAATLAPHAQTPSPISLATPRWGHSATALPGGRIFVAGGTNENGLVRSTEILDISAGQTSAGPPLLTPRSDHTATLLPNGLVLIAGGSGPAGPLASTELFDPSTGSIAAGPSMNVARAGHTATVLGDGSVLMAGGDSAGTAEMYTGDAFAATGGMSVARAGHAAAVLLDGRVMVAGGAGPNGALNSVEIFSAGAFTPVEATMQAARVRAVLNVLPDGKVQIIGGDAGFSIEMFDPDFDQFKAMASLPPLSSLLDATLATASRHALMAGAIGSNASVPSSYAWALKRDGFATVGLGRQVLIVGGASGGAALASGALFPASAATVTTDFLDYNPGSPVAITGTGWTPGETVTLLIHQQPEMRPDTTLTATADSTGAIKNYQFMTVIVDVNTVFTVTASGSASGFQAQTAFSDAAVKKYEASISPTTDTLGHVSAAYALTIANDASSSNDISSATINVPGGYTSVVPGVITTSPAGLNWTASISSGVITLTAAAGPDHLAAGQSVTLALTATAPSSQGTFTWTTATAGSFSLVGTQPVVSITQSRTMTALTASPNPSAYGGAVTLTATVTATSGTPTGSVTFFDGTTAIGSGNLATSGGSTQASISVSTLSVGVHSLTAAYGGAALFASSTSPAHAQTVDRATPAITWSNPADITYGAALGNTQFNATAPVPGSFAYTPAAGTVLSAGPSQTLSVTFTPTDATNYTTAAKSVTINVGKAPLTVTAENKSRTYGDPNPTFTAAYSGFVNGETFATSGITGSPDLTTSATTTSSVAGSPYVITAAAGTLASSNYSFSFVNGQLTITARPITVAADPQTKVYGNADPTLTYKVTSGSLVNGDAFTGGLTRAAGEAVAGSPYAIQQGTLALSANYSLAFTGSDLTITPRPVTITADPQTKVYGATDPTLTYQITSGSLAFNDTFTGALNRAAGEQVGAYAIQEGTLGLSTNYVITYVGASLSITARPITVTADSKSKNYGDTDPAFTYQITSGSLAFSDAFAGGLSRAAGETVAGSPYAIEQGNLALGTNYNLTYVGASLTITARPITVTADAQTKSYGDPDPALTYKVTGGSLVNGDAFTGGLTRAAGETVAASPYAIQQGNLALSTNYALSYVGANLTITARPASVTPNAASKTFNTPDPAFTGTLSGFLPADGVAATYSRTPGEGVAGSPYAISATLTPTAVLGNYHITYNTAQFVINKATPTITWSNPADITYGTALGGTQLNATASVAGSLVYSPAAGTHLNAGRNQTLSVAFTPNDTSDYNAANATVTINVLPATLSVTAENKTMILNSSSLPSLTYTIAGFMFGETLGTSGVTGAPNLSTTAIVGSPIGAYPIVVANGTLQASNYTFVDVNGTLSVTYVVGGACLGDAGHAILSPISVAGTSVFKQGSTTPVKFRVCDANGMSIGPTVAGIGSAAVQPVVADFSVVRAQSGTLTSAIETINSTTPDTAFRWDSTSQQWIFNVSTKSWVANATYQFVILLNDGSKIQFQYGLK